ncbi:MAG TPA: hypothetical protein VJ553_05355 [Candidatus Paceibacterota bacterium]|nr:hypothetical protein [Candidatus Paceibacterota bacterium]
MSDWSWQKLAPGTNYPTLNTRLNGLPDYLRKTQIQPPSTPAIPAAPVAPAASHAKPEEPATPSWLKWLASFNQGVVEGVPFAKTALNKLGLIPESQKKLMEESAKEKPGANIIGSIAGGIGATGAVPMAKAVIGGTGLAAKGLLPSLARGAVNAATFSVPQSVSQAVETGDVAGAVKSGLLGIGTGAVTGAAGEAMTSLLTKGYKAFRNWMTDAVLKSRGVRGKELMKVLQNGIYGRKGYTPVRAMELKEQVADAISKNKIIDKQDLMKFFEDRGNLWDSVDDAWLKAGAKVDDFRDAVVGHADVMDYLTSPLTDPDTGKSYAQYAQSTLDDIFAKAASRKDLASTRELLRTSMINGLKEGTNLGQIKADIAGALRDSIDNRFIPAGLKEEYPALLALKKSIAWNEASVARAGANSATAPRMMLKQILTGGAPGVAIGAGAGATRWDPNDPRGSLARLGKGAAIGAAATLGGNVLNRALSRGGVQLTGRLAGALRNVLPKELPIAFSGLGRVAQAAGTKGAPPAVAALTGPQAPSAPAAAETPADAAVSQSEAQATPETVQAAREKVNTAYRDRVMQALQQDWVNTFAGPFAQYGLKWDDFVQMVGSVTGGFDDPRKTARILFHDKAEREGFLRDYDAALKFGQQNVGAALEYAAPQRLISSITSPKPATSNLAYQDLINYLSGVSEGGKEVSETARKRIEERVRLIAGMKIPEAQKQKMIEEMLANYGIDLNRLTGMGLYGAQNA